MARTYRVGIAGLAHVHVHNVATLFQRHPRVELVACADTVPLTPELSRAPYTRAFNRDYLVNQVGIPRAYEDYRQMLERERLDLVICNSENSRHPDIVEACVDQGAHVCVEKPMAASLADARRMVRAAGGGESRVLIHWYMAFSPFMLRAKALLESGAIGEILEVKMRAAHAGPLATGVKHPGPNVEAMPMTGPELASTWWYQRAAGGGALLDFCSYGAIIARWWLDELPKSVMGWRGNLNSPWSEVEDYGLLLARFGRAVGVFEGSWATREPGLPGGPVVYGTEGTLIVDEWCDQPAVKVVRPGGECVAHAGLALPEGRGTIAEAFIHHLETGDPVHRTLEIGFNAEVTAIVEAGMESAVSGQVSQVRPPIWNS